MKKSEIVKMLKFLDNFYNNLFTFPRGTEQDTESLIETWYLFLGEYDYSIASSALKKLVMNRTEYPPNPGHLVNEIENMLHESDPNQLSGPEAWHMVIDAIQRHSYLYNPDKVKDALPETALKAAEVTGLNTIARSADSDTFIMNRFIKTYEQIQQHENERKMLPGSVREEVEKIERQEVKKLISEKTN